LIVSKSSHRFCTSDSTGETELGGVSITTASRSLFKTFEPLETSTSAAVESNLRRLFDNWLKCTKLSSPKCLLRINLFF